MMEYGATPIEYRDMVTMAENILVLREDSMQLFYETIEEVDDEVLEHLYNKSKPSPDKETKPRKRKGK